MIAVGHEVLGLSQPDPKVEDLGFIVWKSAAWHANQGQGFDVEKLTAG
jgi:hypothetical protein